MKGYTLKDLQDLDSFSYDEVDAILARYERTREMLEYRLERKMGGITASSIAEYDSILSELAQTRDVRRRRAILEQIGKEYVDAEDQGADA